MLQFGRDEVFENVFSLFVDLLIIDDFVDFLQNIVNNFNGHEDSSSFFDIFAKKLFTSLSSFDNVLADGSGFGQSEVSINEIGKVREFQIKRLFVFSKPLLGIFVLYVFESYSGVG